jgi:hypothetical protein
MRIKEFQEQAFFFRGGGRVGEDDLHSLSCGRGMSGDGEWSGDGEGGEGGWSGNRRKKMGGEGRGGQEGWSNFW